MKNAKTKLASIESLVLEWGFRHLLQLSVMHTFWEIRENITKEKTVSNFILLINHWIPLFQVCWFEVTHISVKLRILLWKIQTPLALWCIPLNLLFTKDWCFTSIQCLKNIHHKRCKNTYLVLQYNLKAITSSWKKLLKQREAILSKIFIITQNVPLWVKIDG